MVRKTKPLGLCLALSLGLGLTLILLWSLSGGPLVYAASITVNTADDEFNSDGDCSLREAVRAANTDAAVDACGAGSGADTIQFSLATPAAITLTAGQLTVRNAPLTLQGPGAGLLSISGNGGSRVFDVTSNVVVTLTGLTVRDGNTTGDGGGLRSEGPLTLIGTAFIGNAAGDDGGAIDVQGNLTMTDTEVLSNTAAGQGGGVNAYGTSTRISGGRVGGNRAGDVAGGLYANQSLVLSGTRFVSNTAQTLGGGVYVWGSSTVTNTHFERNVARNYHAGAMYANGDLGMWNSTFVSNTAGGRSGAIWAGSATHVIGGLFSGNVAQAGRAGALDVGDTLWLTGTRFMANRAAGAGGALVHGGSAGQLVNVLLARNRADGDGEALFLAQSGDLQLLHATLVAPSAVDGTAVYVDAGGAVTVVNSIFVSYTHALEVAAGAVYEDYNLFRGTTPISGTAVRGGHSLRGDPAFLDPDHDDYHLSAGSVALNTGTDAGIPTDVEGDGRPGGSGVDIGYDETAHVSDVAIVKTVDTDPAPGAPITYTLTFSNLADALLPGVVITDVLPASVYQVHVSGSVPITDTGAGPPYVWQVQDLGPGQMGVITVSGLLTDPLARGTFTNGVAIHTVASELDGSNNQATAAVTVPNRPPVAVDDVFTTAEEAAVSLSPLANDIDGDVLYVDAFTPPSHGTAALSGTAHILYTPTLDFEGTDLLTYTASDGELTATAAISVVVRNVNDAPVLAEGAAVSVTMSEDGDPVPFLLTLHAADVEDEPLAWSVVTSPTYGVAAVAPGVGISTAVAYTPDANYYGPDDFTVRVSDGASNDDLVVSITVEAVNDAPLGMDDAAVALRRPDGEITILAAGGPETLDVLANDSDLEGDGLAVVEVGAPDHGGTALVSAGGGMVAYTPTATFTGSEAFPYTLSDGALTDTAGVSVTVVNGVAGGVGGDTVVVTHTGAGGAFTVTLEIPVGMVGDGDLALVYDALAGAAGAPPGGFSTAGLFFELGAYLEGQPLGTGQAFPEPLTLTLAYAGAEVTDIGPSENTLTLHRWGDGGWSEGGITLLERDTLHDRLVVTLDRPATFGLFRRGLIYLPLAMNAFARAPDLVVADFVATPADVQVVIANAGNAPVVDEFWVDVYVDPQTPPTGVNQTWPMLGSQGLVWGITADALPLNPGATLTLTLDGPYYEALWSSVDWPLAVGTPVYVQVDSAGSDNDYGTVREIHELKDGAYNNISSTYVKPGAAR